MNLSVTEGQGRASSAAPDAVCSGPAGRAGWAELPVRPCLAPAGDGEEERNSTDPQTARKNPTANC